MLGKAPSNASNAPSNALLGAALLLGKAPSNASNARPPSHTPYAAARRRTGTSRLHFCFSAGLVSRNPRATLGA
jgi:hypothetical protein